MPLAVGGGASNITGASIVDASLGTVDLSTAAIQSLRPTVLTLTPRPNFDTKGTTDAANYVPCVGNTVLRIAQFYFPCKITANKISWVSHGVNVAGTMKVALFSEDGQTQIFTFTTATISAGGIFTHTLGAPVSIDPGVYYLAFMAISTFNSPMRTWGDLVDSDYILTGTVSGEPLQNGTITVTADTMPATISPTGITTGTAEGEALYIRLDN